MEAKDKIIVALDVDNLTKVKSLIDSLSPYVGAFKVGLQLLTAQGPRQIVNFIHHLGGKVFYDGKFNDIPNTVKKVSYEVVKLGVEMFNIHCFSGLEALKAACEVVKEADREKRPLVFGVTILTSLNYKDLVRMGVAKPINFADEKEQKEAEKMEIQNLVKRLALMAEEAGLDGVICSPQEIKILRECCQPEFLIVTPGVRPDWAAVGDQKRVMTPGEAIKAGADYLVIGRPIIDPPKEVASQPADAAILIKDEIQVALMKREKERR